MTLGYAMAGRRQSGAWPLAGRTAPHAVIRSETTPAWNAHIIGMIVAVAAIPALIAIQEWEE